MPPKRGKAEIDPARCKACGLCAFYCPKGCFAPASKLNALGCIPYRFVEGSHCTACGTCGWVCPDLAIRIYEEGASRVEATSSKADLPKVRS
jgi:Fe-S-cluster-containing hydrogenase component 2